MDRKHNQPGGRLKSSLLGAALVTLAVLGPVVAYAGITVVYPKSTFTADVDETPALTFNAGADHATAEAGGWAGAFATTNNDASFTLTVNGLSGGTVTTDKMVNITDVGNVVSYKMEIATALSGISPTVFKARLWTGATAPSADGDPQVCAVLDLTAVGGTESATSCSGDADIQLIYELPDGQTTESGSVEIRPSSIVF